MTAGAAGTIRIAVTGLGGGVDGQTRAYAEYRLFSRLASARDLVDHALVALGGGSRGAARCAITLTLRSGEVRSTDARASHLYDAIDRAVESAAQGVHA